VSFWSRITYVFRGDRLNHEIDEEFAAHIEEAIAAGDDPAEVRRTFGSQLRLREQSRDARIVAWLDCLRADVVFGWRQLLKRKVTTAAAGIALGMASVRYVQTLLFGVKGTDPSMLIAPALVLLAAALLATLPAVLRAARIDPSIMLRAE